MLTKYFKKIYYFGIKINEVVFQYSERSMGIEPISSTYLEITLSLSIKFVRLFALKYRVRLHPPTLNPSLKLPSFMFNKEVK